MANVLKDAVKNATAINDEVIAGNMLSGTKGMATAYFNATVTTPTPELRAIYASNLNQTIAGHSALTELAVNKGWEAPYNPPTQQLSDEAVKATNTIQPSAQQQGQQQGQQC